jgi:hypothetical protein
MVRPTRPSLAHERGLDWCTEVAHEDSAPMRGQSTRCRGSGVQFMRGSLAVVRLPIEEGCTADEKVLLATTTGLQQPCTTSF